MTTEKKTISKDRLIILVMLGFWVLLGLVELLRSGVMALSGQRIFDPHRAFSFVTSYTLAWAILSYPILVFFNKTSNLGWTKKILLHLFFSVIFGFLQYAINSLFYALLMSNIASLWDFILTGPIQAIPFALNAALIYWVVIFLLLVLDYYHKYREASMHSSQLETQLAQSKLQALRMQLHPHFLFNALNTIAMLVRKKQDKDATRMISGLSDMLRIALTSTDRSMISLKEEFTMLKKYLEIEQIRFEDTLKITFDIDDSALDCRVPSLILQPLVENAFKHGISKHIDDSILQISAGKKNGFLMIEIFNTGPELPPNWNIKRNKKVGLTNTIERLNTLYGNDYKFEVYTKEEQGVEVSLQLPADFQQ